MSALFVAYRGGDPQHGGWGPVGRLEHDGGLYRFCYTQGAATLPGFRPFPQMGDLSQVYESEELFPLFANRLLSPSRPEYEAFLRWGGFDPNNPPDPIAILGVTEGIRQTDQVEVFPCPLPDADLCYVNKFFLHGVRWMHRAAQERINQLQPGERLLVMPDPCNEYDPDAVAVRTSDTTDRLLIGYVPRYFARDIQQVIAACDPDFIQISVERVNRDAPIQQRLLCRVRSCWPQDLRPCSDLEFVPIPADMPSRCPA